MSFHPRAGMSAGVSAWRPRSLLDPRSSRTASIERLCRSLAERPKGGLRFDLATPDNTKSPASAVAHNGVRRAIAGLLRTLLPRFWAPLGLLCVGYDMTFS